MWRKLWLLGCWALVQAQELPSAADVLRGAEAALREPPVMWSIVVVPALLAVDRAVAEVYSPLRSGGLLWQVARLYGERWMPLAVAAGAYGIGWLLDNQQLQRVGIAVAGSAVVAGIVTATFKVTAGRARPEVNAGALAFSPWSFDDRYQSFPSGHAAVGFATTTALVATLKPSLAIQVAAYGLAGLTAISRLYRSRHWLSDVVAGASVGYAAARAVALAVNGRQAASLDVLPLPGKGVGIACYIPLLRPEQYR
ncbi:MAG: phosphatase PAP2 family protein [Chlorobiota bacterium]